MTSLRINLIVVVASRDSGRSVVGSVAQLSQYAAVIAEVIAGYSDRPGQLVRYELLVITTSMASLILNLVLCG